MSTDLPAGRLILRPDVVSTVLHDGAVLLDLRSKYFYSANASAWAVVQQFEAGATAYEARRACAALGAREADSDAIDAVIRHLVADDLVEPLEGPGQPAGEPAAILEGAAWSAPSLTRHHEPLQRIMVSAFDPGIPMAE